MPTAIQIADWIVRVRHDEMDAPVDSMSLEKLVYYAQCFHLALTGEELFPDEIRAWKLGPVIPSIYNIYREHGAHPIIPTPGDTPRLDARIEVFLFELLACFGRYNAVQLSNATHAEDPWLSARHGYGRHDNSNVLIPVNQMRRYYCTLISEGEEALSRHELLDVVSEPRWAGLYVAGICSRRIFNHPFYRAALAKKISQPVPELEDLPSDFYSPVKSRSLIEFREGDDVDEIIKRTIASN